MSAFGELFIYLIYVLLGLTGVVFFLWTYTSKKVRKPWTLLGGLFFTFLLFYFKSCQNENYKRNQLSQVGKYYLTDYPNCKSCYIELKENMTYNVIDDGKIIETSNWHYESGGDYWITYLDNDKYQLGNGKFNYKKYELKYSKVDDQ